MLKSREYPWDYLIIRAFREDFSHSFALVIADGSKWSCIRDVSNYTSWWHPTAARTATSNFPHPYTHHSLSGHHPDIPSFHIDPPITRHNTIPPHSRHLRVTYTQHYPFFSHTTSSILTPIHSTFRYKPMKNWKWSFSWFSNWNLVTTCTLSSHRYSEPKLFIPMTIWNSDGRCVQRTGTHSPCLDEAPLLGIPYSPRIYKRRSYSSQITLSTEEILYCACCPGYLRASRTCYSLHPPVLPNTCQGGLTGSSI